MYGDKISQLRRNANLTQSQLGDLLNVSAQAVSKWEHDLSEPDLATVKKMTEIFDISVDYFLDIEEKNNIPKNINEVIEQTVNESQKNDLGVCSRCGKKVTKDNVGQVNPVLLCEKCSKNDIEEREKKEKIHKKAKEEGLKGLIKTKRKSIIVSSILAVLVFAFGMAVSFSNVSDVEGTIICFFFFLFLTYSTYAFVSELIIDDGPVANILLWFVSCPIKMPGVIFTLDIGGLIFLIVVKIGLAVLAFLVGIFMFLVGLCVGFIVAPFSFPFSIAKLNKKIKEY